jgi:hypothetical protein
MIVFGARHRILALLLSASVGIAAACTSGTNAPASGSPSALASAAPSATGFPTTTPPTGTVTTAEEAVARVVVERPDLAAIGPFDPDRIGGCCWYRASQAAGGFEVEFRVGWGDCPAGCIEEYTWTYRVAADGTVELLAEGGDPIPPEGVPQR